MQSVAAQLSPSIGRWFYRLSVACAVALAAFAPPAGAVERRNTNEMRDLTSPFKWQGKWINTHKQDAPGRFPWEHTRIEDKFDGDFAFS